MSAVVKGQPILAVGGERATQATFQPPGFSLWMTPSALGEDPQLPGVRGEGRRLEIRQSLESTWRQAQHSLLPEQTLQMGFVLFTCSRPDFYLQETRTLVHTLEPNTLAQTFRNTPLTSQH